MNVYPARAAFAVRSIVIKVASRSAIILDILMIFSAECLSEYLGWRRIPAPDRRGGVVYPVARTGGRSAVEDAASARASERVCHMAASIPGPVVATARARSLSAQSRAEKGKFRRVTVIPPQTNANGGISRCCNCALHRPEA